MDSHIETIECPECKKIQDATVEHRPFWNIYLHECSCGFVIMESDWNKVTTKPIIQ